MAVSRFQANQELANRRLGPYGYTVGQACRFPVNSASKRRTRTGRILDVEPDGSLRVADDRTHALHSIPADRITITRTRSTR